MNAISKEDAMRALPVDRAGLATYTAQVQSFQASRARTWKRAFFASSTVAGVLLLTVLGQAWTVASLLPLTKLVPIYLWTRPDGTVDSSVSMSSLPATQSQAVIRAELWQYVRLREGYGRDEAQYAYDAVSALSAPDVRRAYQAWFNYPNPASPQVRIGGKGHILIQPISVALLNPRLAQVRFQRLVEMDGGHPVVTTWTATVQFALVRDLPAVTRLGNPGGVIVTAYQADEDSAP